MFKPLLRTMPSLTGNVKLVCVLNNYELVDEHIFEVNVRTGQLLGLSSQLFNKYINVSLLNSSYEWDLKQADSKAKSQLKEQQYRSSAKRHVDDAIKDAKNTAKKVSDFSQKQIDKGKSWLIKKLSK